MIFKKIKHQGMIYHVNPEFAEKLLECNFKDNDQDITPLVEMGRYRSICVSKKINMVIKNNTLTTFRRRLYTHFGVQGLSGRFSLVDEYKNLKALSHIDFVPKVYAFGKCSRFPIKEERLIIEYYEDALTADEMLRLYPEKKI